MLLGADQCFDDWGSQFKVIVKAQLLAINRRLETNNINNEWLSSWIMYSFQLTVNDPSAFSLTSQAVFWPARLTTSDH